MKMKPAAWIRIFPGARKKIFKKGEVMVLEGGSARELFVILSGKVRVEKRIRGRDPLLLASLGPGEILGELSILTGRRRSATAVAERNVVALLVPAIQVKSMLVGGQGVKGRFQEQMMESLARRLVRLLERLPMYQGVFSEPRTAAGLRRAMEKMYANWAI
jgi:CRP-like cAMP-binding protein